MYGLRDRLLFLPSSVFATCALGRISLYASVTPHLTAGNVDPCMEIQELKSSYQRNASGSPNRTK